MKSTIAAICFFIILLGMSKYGNQIDCAVTYVIFFCIAAIWYPLERKKKEVSNGNS